MRRGATLSLAILLGLAATLNPLPLLAAQEQADEPCDPANPEVVVPELDLTLIQDCRSDFSDGLEFAGLSPSGPPEVERLYAVRFFGDPAQDVPNPGLGAYIPERYSSQAMVVKVLAGSFAFRTQGPGVIVAPQDQTLGMYFTNLPIGYGTNPNDRNPGEESVRREFTEDGSFPCDLNPSGQAVCSLDPSRFENGDVFARLDPGDIVYLPDDSTCFVCNTELIDGIPPEVLIWTPATGFNGDLELATNAMAPQESTPTAQGPARIVGWAFNPGSRCN